MGQISLPVLNRTGYSMFWQSVWDSKFNYNRNWKEDFLIRTIIPFIFIHKLTRLPTFTNPNCLLKNTFFLKPSIFNLFDHPGQLKTTVDNFFFAKKKAPLYILRIWVIKFQKWLIIYFSTYSPIKIRIISSNLDLTFFRTTQLGIFFINMFKKKSFSKYYAHNEVLHNNF
jgi:hypothetical protein